jgi:hypothetical protein
LYIVAVKQLTPLEAARAAPTKQALEAHREAIELLRNKGYSWREIASFLNEHGVTTDHTAIYRLIKGRSDMTTATDNLPYEPVRSLIQGMGGEMTWLAGGAPGGGTWELVLHGRTARIPVRDNQVNDLDRLYVSKVENPKNWADYDQPAALRPGAFWDLLTLFGK